MQVEGRAEIDWFKVFAQKPIIAVLAQYLTINDWFSLSATTRTMYGSWSTAACIDAINMRKLVKDRFGWSYKKKNPFIWVRKHMSSARLPFLCKPPATFRCTGGCGSQKGHTKLMSSRLAKYATCDDCFCTDWTKRTITSTRRKGMYSAIRDRINDTHVCTQIGPIYHRCHVIECLDKIIGESTREFVLSESVPAMLKQQKRLYNWRNSQTLAFSAREYGYGPIVVARKDIERCAESDVSEFKLVKRYRQWLDQSIQSKRKNEED